MKRVIAMIATAGLLVGCGSALLAGTAGASSVSSIKPSARSAVLHQSVGIAAVVIGVSPQALIAEVKGGKSIAQVAAEHGVDLQLVVDQITHIADQIIDAAVRFGFITPEQATTLKAKLDAFVVRLMAHSRRAITA